LEYAEIFDRFDILVLAKGRKVESEKMAVWPMESDGKILSIIKAYKIGLKMAKQFKSDLISAQDPFFTGLVGWFLKRKTGLPLQIQVHTDFLSAYFWQESLMNKLRVLTARFLLKRADGIRVASERIKKSLESGIKNLKSNIETLPIFVDAEKTRQAPIKSDLRQKYPQFDFIILMASRLTKEKNIPLAIDVFAEIVKSYRRAGLVIVGEGPEGNNLRFKILNLKLSDKIILEPWTEDLSSYYKTADVFLLTSNYEGYGLAVVEAMACGLPIVMTEVGCAGEIVKDWENGLVVSVNNKRKLQDAIEELMNNKILKEKLRANAEKIFLQMPTKKQSLELYKKISEQALGN
jgi:1,2-diacylglycerol 3-alpha-glucosyltransferase